MGSENSVLVTVISALIAAVGWLGKRLYDSPRTEEVQTLRKERDELRKIVDDAALESRLLAKERDEENRKLRDEISGLRSKVEFRASRAAPHAVNRDRKNE